MHAYDLSRYTKMHTLDFDTALSEIKSGKKRSHWMWYIFPQIQGLGMSSSSQYYAIQNLEETKAFLADSYLGNNLLTICHALLALDSNNPSEIFGYPDDMKLCSSMTLFSCACDDEVFPMVLDKFFDGKKDDKTLKLLGLQA